MKVIIIMIFDAALYFAAVVFLILAIFKVEPFLVPIAIFVTAFLLEMGIFAYEIKHAVSDDDYEDDYDSTIED